MGSMHTGLEEEKGGMRKLAAFYGERAAGEAGLIVTGGIAPNMSGVVAWEKLHVVRHHVIASSGSRGCSRGRRADLDANFACRSLHTHLSV